MKLFVFDIDDTLCKTAKLHQRLFTEALHRLGIPEFDDHFHAYLHHTDRYISNEIYEKQFSTPMSDHHVEEMEEKILLELKKNEIIQIPGAVKFLDSCRKAGVGVCFATGAYLKTGKYKLDKLGIDYEDALVIGSNDKMERESIVNSAIAAAQKYYKQDRFNEIISFGDGLWDLNTANHLEIGFVGIGAKNHDLLKSKGANQVYENFEILLLEQPNFLQNSLD